MNKAILMCGKDSGREDYQLLIGNNYDYIEYDSCENHEMFLDKISSFFAKRVLEEKVTEFGLLKGKKIGVQGEGILITDNINSDLIETRLKNTIIKLAEGKPLMVLNPKLN